MISYKKGNVDADLVFSVMKTLVERDDFEKIFIVSGDGDYYKMVRYLIDKERFGKMLFPNKRFRSSLYKRLGDKHTMYLYSVKDKIEYLKLKKEKGG
ncbi:MAG: NYN domain-containing protein [Candidatus Spechtbacteria bacterium SB0662_bin_43]|uniref:NYN domain-containing protein n=1 Tax=Candidatus Spechtbacteria bacterium SB0662_bin_43 TaxID=2604897 RepID=A0A845DDR2_9BACT|nr:NYN domain-containing protein [Candidatus Spechtbacteria bacterium SB0662_bin_43]